MQNIPRDSDLGSPAQRLMSRRLKTIIPTAKSLLKPSTVSNVRSKLTKIRQQKNAYYNKDAKMLKSLKQKQVVRMKTDRGHDK